MRPISHYFPFVIVTILLYGFFFHHYQQSTVIPTPPLNSGQQALQLQFVEIANELADYAEENEPPQPASHARQDQPKPAENKETEQQTSEVINAENHSEIKIAKQKLQKAIRETAAENDAELKAALFEENLQLDSMPPAAAAKSSDQLPVTASSSPVKTPESSEITAQQKQAKPVLKKHPARSSSNVQTQGVLQEAIVVSGHIPVYPKRAILRNQQGRVQVKLTVTTKGKAKNPQIITSSGHAILDNAVLNFVRRELFMPAHKGEEKVTTEQIFSFRFELK